MLPTVWFHDSLEYFCVFIILRCTDRECWVIYPLKVQRKEAPALIYSDRARGAVCVEVCSSRYIKERVFEIQPSDVAAAISEAMPLWISSLEKSAIIEFNVKQGQSKGPFEKGALCSALICCRQSIWFSLLFFYLLLHLHCFKRCLRQAPGLALLVAKSTMPFTTLGMCRVKESTLQNLESMCILLKFIGSWEDAHSEVNTRCSSFR